MNKIRVLLAEDQGMVRGALAALLNIEPDIAVVESVPDGQEALRAVGRDRPDVVVTDIEMPHMTGLELAVRVRELYPDTRVVIVTTFARPGYLRRALDAGASGYLLKDRPASELADAVRRVHRGLRVVDPALAAEIWNAEDDPLTAGRRGRNHGRTGQVSPAKRRHGAQLSVRGDFKARCGQSYRSRQDRASQGMALNYLCRSSPAECRKSQRPGPLHERSRACP